MSFGHPLFCNGWDDVFFTNSPKAKELMSVCCIPCISTHKGSYNPYIGFNFYPLSSKGLNRYGAFVARYLQKVFLLWLHW